MSRLRIIWLCSWYPNRLDPYDGDFIQRHARAASLYNDIHVIRVVADTTGSTTSRETVIHQFPGLTEQVIYFPSKKGFWGRFWNFYRWWLLCKQAINIYIAKNGLPEILHVHIPMKSGLAALWFKWLYNIPYIITEHYVIYNKIIQDNYSSKNWLYKIFFKQIMRQSVCLHSVSRYLAEEINKIVHIEKIVVIPNVTDTLLFCNPKKIKGVFTFIHVSTLSERKNIIGIIRSFARLYKEIRGIRLIVVGKFYEKLISFVDSLNLETGVIEFTGELPYEEVAAKMKQSNCFILFSKIENSPCVISEALCCGLPVIATQVGGIPEMIDENNGLLIPPGDEMELKKAMLHMKINHSKFDRSEIATKASRRFGYSTVGQQFNFLYMGVKK